MFFGERFGIGRIDEGGVVRAHVDALVGKDPFGTSGVVAAATTSEWEPVIGPLLAAL